MSHALCIVALSPEDTREHGNIDAALTWQMKPFEETDEWFQDGSRWDWYVVGGRYSGRFLGKDYCERGELTEERLISDQEKRARKLWADWEAEKGKDDFLRSHIYGLEKEDTLESVVARYRGRTMTAFAFLRDRKWHEAERMGWFGLNIKTECQISAEAKSKDGEVDLATWTGRCVTKDEAMGAQIVDFTGPKDSNDRWNDLFWPRFIRPLPPETTLVAVDYHV